uniref:Uncharacterized protein n=1 Tax=Rhizophora mucronata TaxID=61149 RepID=A0A2P2PTT7_RHIMU
MTKALIQKFLLVVVASKATEAVRHYNPLRIKD